MATSCSYMPGQTRSTPMPVVSASSLLIDVKPFPAHWERTKCTPDCSRREGETRAYRSFYDPTIAGHVIQDVVRHKNVREAQAEFKAAYAVDFRERQRPNTQLIPPATIQYHSRFADEYYLGCGIDEVSICVAILRYGNYYVRFFFHIDTEVGEGLEITEVEPILREMDAHVANTFGLSLSLNTTSP